MNLQHQQVGRGKCLVASSLDECLKKTTFLDSRTSDKNTKPLFLSTFVLS